MNIEFLNNKREKQIQNINFNNKLEEGQNINGEIKEEKDGKYKISLDGNITINIDKDKIKGKVGDKVSFSVLEGNKMMQITEKLEPEEKIVKRANLKSKDFNINISQQKYKSYLNKNAQPTVQENILYKTNLKNKLGHVSNTISEESLKEIINKNLDAKKLDLFSFSDCLSESLGEETKKDAPKSIDELQKEEENKNIKMDLNMNGVDEEAIFSFESVFTNTSLPLTDKNIENIKNIKDKIEDIKGIDKNSVLNMLKEGKKPTLENIYTAKHSRNSSNFQIDISKIGDVDNMLKNLFEKLDIEATQENLEIGKEFIKNQIDISRENIDNYKKLSNIEENINSEDILISGAKNIIKNKSPLDIDIFNSEQNYIQKYKGYKNLIENISEENLQYLIDNKMEINLSNIEKYSDKISTESVSTEAIEKRLSLAKIQMKLTTDNIYTLAKNGINIDTKPLQNVINELEKIEQAKYKASLENIKAGNISENTKTMSKVFDAMQNIFPKKVYNVFRDIINKDIDFSIEGINQGIKAKKVLQDLDTFATTINKKFGDSIKKLDSDFEKLLQENGFEVNETNKKALKILSLNELDFNDENFINVKLIDSKLDYIHNNLHPLTVSKMLKEGFNPMDKNIDEVIDYINKDENLKTSREKIAEQILSMDNKNMLSSEERKAVISVYRMINAIEKDGSASIGSLLKSEKNITFNNLLDSAKIYQKNKKNLDFDKTVDDENGLTSVLNFNNNIKNNLDNWFENSNAEYNKMLINKALDYIKSEDIDKALKQNVSLEKTLEEIGQIKNMPKEFANEVIQNARNIDSISKDAMDYFYDTDMKINLNNINMLENIISGKKSPSYDIANFKDEMEKRNLDFDISIIDTLDDKKYDKEEAKSSLLELDKESETAFDKILGMDNFYDIKYMIGKNNDIFSSISFLKDNNNSKSGAYSFPMKLKNGKIADLNMYILNDKALDDKNLSFYVNISSEGKNIESYIKVFDGGKFAKIIANENAKDYEEDILNVLNKFDIEPEKIIYKDKKADNMFKRSISDIKDNLVDFDNEVNHYI